MTRKLRAGVDSHVVAALVGHKDTKMIDSVYSHVADDHEFMLDAAKKNIRTTPLSLAPARGGPTSLLPPRREWVENSTTSRASQGKHT